MKAGLDVRPGNHAGYVSTAVGQVRDLAFIEHDDQHTVGLELVAGD